MEHFKRSTARDFKIDGQTVQAKLSENTREDLEGDIEEGEGESGGEGGPPNLKRIKTA